MHDRSGEVDLGRLTTQTRIRRTCWLATAIWLLTCGCTGEEQSLRPKSAVLLVGGTVTFTRVGEGSATFSIDEGASGGAITPDGIYTAPLTAGVYHVRIRSNSEPDKSAVATVSVVGPVAAPSQAKVGDTISATIQAPDSVTLTWKASRGTILGSSGVPTISVLTGVDDVVLSVLARDAEGASATASATVEVFPVPDVATPDFVLAGGRSTAAVRVAGSRFTYRWNVTGGQVVGPPNGSSIAYSAGEPGQLTVSTSAVNSAGHAGPTGSAAVTVARFGLQLLAGAASGGGSVDGLGGEARFFFNKHAAGNFAGAGQSMSPTGRTARSASWSRRAPAGW